MSVVVLAGLSLALAWGLYRYGGTVPADWNISCLAIGILAALSRAFVPFYGSRPRLSRGATALFAALAAFLAFQYIPVPLWLVRVCSPARTEIVSALGPVMSVPAWTSLTNNPAATLEAILRAAAGLAVFLTLRDLTCYLNERAWILTIPLLVLGSLEAGLGIFQAQQASGAMAVGTYINHNHFSGVLEFCLPLAIVYGVWVMRGRRERHSAPAGPAVLACTLLGVAALLFVGIMQSMSRMGFIAALASLLLLAAASVKRRSGIILVLLLILAAGIVLPSDQFIARFGLLRPASDVAADLRPEMWRDTLHLIRAYPIFGCGLGAYQSSFLLYKRADPMEAIEYAHSDYLHFLAELGAVGFSIALAIAIRTLFCAFRVFRIPPGEPERYLALACAASLVALAVHSIADFNLNIPANAMVIFWIGGMVEGLWERRRANPMWFHAKIAREPARAQIE